MRVRMKIGWYQGGKSRAWLCGILAGSILLSGCLPGLAARPATPATGGWLATATAEATSTTTPAPTETPLPTATATLPPLQPLQLLQPLPQHPNLVVILTDDLDLRLGTLEYLPNVQRELIARGASFEHFLVADPVCCPSRVSFLRGQYLHNHTVYSNAAPAGSFLKAYATGLESSTLGTWLQSAGYRTGYMGKYMNEYPQPKNQLYIPPGWDEWYVPAHGGAYAGMNYEMNENGKLVAYGDQAEDYLTDVISQKAVEFIQQSASAGDQPFLLYLAPYAPHLPARAAPRHKELFSDLRAPRTASFNEADVSDKPANLRELPLLTANEIKDIDGQYRYRVRSMMAVDEMIAALLLALEESQQMEKTYIFFTSDNGYHLGQHRMKRGKATPYDEDIHVPFIVRGPGVPAGLVIQDYLVGNIDFAPTLAELAGASLPDFVDGRSLLPLLRGGVPQGGEPQGGWRSAFLVEHYGVKSPEEAIAPGLLMVEYSDFPGSAGKPAADQVDVVKTFAVLRTPRYKYIEYADGFIELYDLLSDPDELQNLSATADPALLAQLGTWLGLLESCSGAQCRQVEMGWP